MWQMTLQASIRRTHGVAWVEVWAIGSRMGFGLFLVALVCVAKRMVPVLAQSWGCVRYRGEPQSVGQFGKRCNVLFFLCGVGWGGGVGKPLCKLQHAFELGSKLLTLTLLIRKTGRPLQEASGMLASCCISCLPLP